MKQEQVGNAKDEVVEPLTNEEIKEIINILENIKRRKKWYTCRDNQGTKGDSQDMLANKAKFGRKNKCQIDGRRQLSVL